MITIGKNDCKEMAIQGFTTGKSHRPVRTFTIMLQMYHIPKPCMYCDKHTYYCYSIFCRDLWLSMLFKMVKSYNPERFGLSFPLARKPRSYALFAD